MPFVRGQSGNPRGRPRNKPELAPALRALLLEHTDGRTTAEAIARALIDRAITGDIEAIKVVLDRVDGKVTTPVEVGGGAAPVRIEVVFVDERVGPITQGAMNGG